MMAIGIQCINDAGGFQIDGVYPQFILRRKVDVAMSYLVYGEVVSYSGAALSVAGDEIVALSSSTPCAITYKQGSLMRIVSQGGIGTIVTAYVFGPVTSSSVGGMGLQVFNSSGAIVFDSAQKPLVMVGFPTGEGNFTYNGSRAYAAICVNQVLTQKDTRTGGGGYETIHYEVTQGMIRSIPGGVNISNIKIYDTYFYPDPSGGMGGGDQTIPSGTPNRHIIVDVTYF